VWPNRTDNPFTEVLNSTQKYVASRTLTDPLPWQNSTVLSGDAVAAVSALKATPGHDLSILGSGELLQSLIVADLIDSYVLLIHPLLLGAGRRLFSDGSPPATLQLTASVVTTKGVVIATYERVRSSQ
jgi:dihydrofolate reductase